MSALTNVAPSPNPLTSPSETNNSITEPGRAQPLTVNEPFASTALSMTGKFTSALPPVSPSPLSLRVTNGLVPRPASSPLASRSIPTCPVVPPPALGALAPLPEKLLRVRIQPLPVLETSTPAPTWSWITQRSTVPPLPPRRSPALTAPPPRPFWRTLRFVHDTPLVAPAASMPGPSPPCTDVRVAVSVPLADSTIWPSAALPSVLLNTFTPSTVQPSEPAVNAIPLPFA